MRAAGRALRAATAAAGPQVPRAHRDGDIRFTGDRSITVLVLDVGDSQDGALTRVGR